MKKRTILLVLSAFLMLIVGAGMQVSAGAIGDDWTIGGYNPGLVLIGIGLLIVAMGYFGIWNLKKVAGFGIGAMLIGAIFLVPFTAQTVETDTSDSDCPMFEISGSAITSGNTDDISSTTWDDDTLTLTIPLTVADSSDGNLTGYEAGVNLTIDPMGAGRTTEDMATVTVTTDYLMKYGGEYIIDETGGDYDATITTADGTEYYEDTIDIQLTETAWAEVEYDFVNGTSGSWVSELSQIGDSVTWYITVENSCGTQTETITVNAIVVSYTE